MEYQEYYSTKISISPCTSAVYNSLAPCDSIVSQHFVKFVRPGSSQYSLHHLVRLVHFPRATCAPFPVSLLCHPGLHCVIPTLLHQEYFCYFLLRIVGCVLPSPSFCAWLVVFLLWMQKIKRNIVKGKPQIFTGMSKR